MSLFAFAIGDGIQPIRQVQKVVAQKLVWQVVGKKFVIFVLYGMELWLKHSSGLTYADDISTSIG